MASTHVAPLPHGAAAHPSTVSATVTVRVAVRVSPPELVTEYTSATDPSTPGLTLPDTRTAALKSPSTVSLATAPGSDHGDPASCVTTASPTSVSVSVRVFTSHVGPPQPSVHVHVKPPMVSAQLPWAHGVGTQALTVSATVMARVADAELPCAFSTVYRRVYTPGTDKSTEPVTATRSAGSAPSNGSVAVNPGSTHDAVADASAVMVVPPVRDSVGNTWFCLSQTSPSHKSSHAQRWPPTVSLQVPWLLHGAVTAAQPSTVSTT